MSYTIDRTYTLGVNEGDSNLTKENLYIIAHETANPDATGANEASYMKRNWRKAYTQYVVGDGKVYLVGEPGYVAYGALDANDYSPVQIELQHNKELFSKNYPIYIELIRDSAKKYNIPLTLDEGGKGTKGVKSHLWVTEKIGGNHTDPYGFLAENGISKEQFRKDIANGIGNTSQEKPKTNADFKVGDKIKVVDALYIDSYGKGRSTAKRNQQGTIKRIVNGANKPFLINDWGWGHSNDIQKVKNISKNKDWSSQYYTTNPKKVKLLKADGLYGKSDVDFKGGKIGGSYPKGTVFNITGIKKRKDGLPRLITQSGFLLTANKKYVKKI